MKTITKRKTWKGWICPSLEINEMNSPALIKMQFGLHRWKISDERQCKITVEWQEPVIEKRKQRRKL